MQTLGIVGQSNVTVTTFSSDEDRAETNRIKSSDDFKGSPDKALFGVTFKNMRSRFARQGAEDVRYYPIN